MSPSSEIERIVGEESESGREIDFDRLVEKARKAELKALKKAEKETQKANAETEERENRKSTDEKEDDSRKGGKLRFETVLDRSEAATYLEAIARGLRNGSLQFRREEEALALSPAERVDLSVKAASKKNRESVTFELEWRAQSEGELAIVAD